MSPSDREHRERLKQYRSSPQPTVAQVVLLEILIGPIITVDNAGMGGSTWRPPLPLPVGVLPPFPGHQDRPDNTAAHHSRHTRNSPTGPLGGVVVSPNVSIAMPGCTFSATVKVDASALYTGGTRRAPFGTICSRFVLGSICSRRAGNRSRKIDSGCSPASSPRRRYAPE